MRLTASAVVLAAGALAFAAPAAAQGNGAWQTFLRAFSYTQLLARADTVWCATGEAGLLRFDSNAGTFTSITREPGGLASNDLTALTRDRSGNLWVGTLASGVSRLGTDGRWGLVNAFDGIPSEQVTVLEVGTLSDSVWIGTKGGVALWDGNEIAGALPDGVNPSPFASDDITGIVVHADSQFISTTLGMYLRRPGGGSSVIDSINTGLSSQVVEGLASDGLDVFARAAGVAHRYVFATSSWTTAGSIGVVWRLQDDGTNVYASTNQGVYRWNGIGWSLIDGARRSTGTPNNTFAVTGDGAGNVFAANLNGVYRIPPTGPPAILRSPNGPPGNNMLNTYVQDGRVYVNTLAAGVGRFDGQTWRNWFPGACTAGCDTTFLNPEFTFALLAGRDGRKWVAAWGHAMEVFDDSVSPPAFTRPTWNDGIDPSRHTRAAAAVLDSSGGHWFGMDTHLLGEPEWAPLGLDYYDSLGFHAGTFRPESIASMRGNGKIKALTVDRLGRIWVGHAGAGVQFFSWSPSLTAPVFSDVNPIENLDVRGLVASGDTIWAATTSDLRWYSASSIPAQLGRSFPVPAPISPLALNPVTMGPGGRVWLGTFSGIRVYNPDGSTFADFTTVNSPLAADEVRAIRVDAVTGAVWIATAGGLNRFDPFFVPPVPPRLPSLDVRVFPNPAMLTGIGTRVSLQGNASAYRGRIYDITGRLVREFDGAPNGTVVWDGRDVDGRMMDPGVYFLRVEAGGRESTVRIVLLR